MTKNASTDSVMNPNWVTLGKIYAQALFESIDNFEENPHIADQLIQIAKILQDQPDFAKLMSAGSMNKDQRVLIIEKVFKDRIDDSIFKLLGVLAQNDRLYLVNAIAKSFSQLIEKQANQIEVQVTLACEMSPEQKSQLTKTLEKVLKAKPILKCKIVPEIVGGIKLRIGDAVYDASVAGALEQIKNKMQHNSYAKSQDNYSHENNNNSTGLV